MSDGSKTFRHEIVIKAKPEDVWRAISEGEELQKWFPLSARVKPGVGGSVFLSWGPACEGEAPIDVWRPAEALGWSETHAGGVKIAAQFTISRGPGAGETTLRIVQSGFGEGQPWLDMYDSIANGWKYELRSLRHYLERHAGQPREAIWLMSPTALAAEVAWARLAAPGAMVKEGVPETGSEGEPFALTTPGGERWSGTILRTIPRRSFVGVVRELNDGLLRIETERSGEKSSANILLGAWGKARSAVLEQREAWESALHRLFPQRKA